MQDYDHSIAQCSPDNLVGPSALRIAIQLTCSSFMSLQKHWLVASAFSLTMVGHDLIQKAILQDIEQYRIQSYQRFAVKICAHPARSPNPVYKFNGFWIGWTRYDLDIHGQPPIRMEIHIDHDGRTKFLHMGKWVFLQEFLEILQPKPQEDPALSTPRGCWDHQWAWWCANGKAFRFMDLPVELRQLVYEHAFGPRVEPYPGCSARRLGSKTGAIMARMANTKILHLNKQVYEESSHILFQCTLFFIEHLEVLGALTRNPRLKQGVRKLELALSHHQFFQLFGGLSGTCQSGNVCYKPHKRIVQHFQHLELSSLTLTFTAPSIATGHDHFDGACQKTVVDWLLDAAWPFIRGNVVKLNGYIKDHQRAAFEAACLVDRNRYESWQLTAKVAELATNLLSYHEWVELEDADNDGGVRLDGSTTQTKEQKQWTKHGDCLNCLPPGCRCEPPCTPKTWKAED